jgi:RNA polymerase sigma-70 factor (TIGR02943 family)
MLDPAPSLGISQPFGPVSPGDGEQPEAQLATWVDDHADALYRFALLRVRDKHAVEDLLQETYLAALGSNDRFRGDSSTRTWLVAILRLKIIDYYRRSNKEPKQQPAAEPIDSSQQKKIKLRKWDCDPSRTLEKKEFWQTLRSCVDKLPATLTKAFLLRELDGCSPRQVSELLNITPENLAVRVYRARALLRDCLDHHWFKEG